MNTEQRGGVMVGDHVSLPSAPVLHLIDRGKLDAAITVYRRETGASVEQAETVLRDASLLSRARERADQMAMLAQARQQADRDAREGMPRPAWAYAVGLVALLVLAGSVTLLVSFVVDINQEQGYGYLILAIAGPPLGVVAIAASVVLVWCYLARQRRHLQ